MCTLSYYPKLCYFSENPTVAEVLHFRRYSEYFKLTDLQKFKFVLKQSLISSYAIPGGIKYLWNVLIFSKDYISDYASSHLKSIYIAH
jgi:hypothetical protein